MTSGRPAGDRRVTRAEIGERGPLPRRPGPSIIKDVGLRGWLSGRRRRKDEVAVHLSDGTRVRLPFIEHLFGQIEASRRRRARFHRYTGDPIPAPYGEALKASRRARLHPSIDSIGPKVEAVTRAWIGHVGIPQAPEIVGAWERGEQTTVLLYGPVPDEGPPGVVDSTYSLGVSFEMPKQEVPLSAERLVKAEVYGDPPPHVAPRKEAASDGLLVPLGYTEGGVFHLPLLGPSGAGPLALSGEGAPGLLASLLLYAAARLGQDNLKALVYEPLSEHVSALTNVETFGPGQLEDVVVYLEEEWTRRGELLQAAKVEDFRTYALLPDVEPIPVLLLLLGVQAAGTMRLTDPVWPSILQGSRHGMSTLVWGEAPKAARAVEVGLNEGVAVIGGRRPDQIPYTLPPVRFAPAILSPEVRAEAAAILRGAEHPAATTAPVEQEATVPVKQATPIETAMPDRDEQPAPASVTKLPAPDIVVEEKPEKPERAIYCLGGLRVEHKGVVVEPWRRRGALQLLAFLITYPNGRRQDAILEAIWPEGRPRNARKSLNQLVSEVRRKLGGDPKEMPLIVVAGDHYRIDWDHVWADAHAFREALAAAERVDDPVPNLKDAVDLYRGDFCKDAYFSWTEDERYGLERTYVDAVLKLADTLIERDGIEAAHSIVDRALGIDPYSDALARRAMALDARRFGRAAAIERFRRFRAAVREIGVEPEPETLSLADSLRGADEL